MDTSPSISKYHNILVSHYSDDDIVKANQSYEVSDISLGMFKNDSKLESDFIDKFTYSGANLFIFSEVPKKGAGLGGGGDDNIEFLFRIGESIALGLTVNIIYDLIKIYGKKFFSNLKSFLTFAHKRDKNNVLIKIKNINSGNILNGEISYIIPKYVNVTEIKQTVELIEKDLSNEKIKRHRLFTKLIFDKGDKKFREL